MWCRKKVYWWILDKIKAIMKWHVPKNITNIRYFMRIIGYYRKFIEGFSKSAYPIISLQNKGKKFDWNENFEECFNKLRHLLTTPILKIINPYKYFAVCRGMQRRFRRSINSRKICYRLLV